MSRSPDHLEPPRSRYRGCRQGAAVLAALLLAAGAGWAQPPTVNGLFHGDGDVNLYQPYATSVGGSVLHSYLDIATSRLYVALVVNHAVNDLVCSPKTNQAYTASATPPWGSHRDCKRASDSEFASFTLECAPGSPQAWSWQQALGCAQTPGPPPSNWISAPSCPSSLGVWPPSIVASTSWVRNINTYQMAAPPTRAWNLYALGTALSNWKSPFVASSPNNVQAVPGYNTYSTTNGMGQFYQWEWSMVYEWSVNLGPGGTNCGNEAIFFVTGQSHHSPPKSGPENDTFPPPDEPPILSDYGDLPNTYSTLKANNGPRHYLKVNGPYLGAQVQTEGDGVPTAGATGDGPEEDGLTINLTSNWTPGSTQTITVTAGNVGAGTVLAGWFDWNGDGVFGAGEFLTWPLTMNGPNNLSLTVGAGFDWQNDSLAVRLRVFSSPAVAPGGSLDSGDFAGTATDGEVEDYVFAAGSLPVTLNAFASEFAGGGSLSVRWQTATETDNVGFELLGLVDGDWRPLTEFVASKGMNSALPQSYEVELFLAPEVTMLELVDYDSRGRPERFGPFRPGAVYGELQPARKIDWKRPRETRAERLAERGFVATGRPGQAVSEARPARWRKLRDPKQASGQGQPTVLLGGGALTHVAVTRPGIQRVSYEALRDAGLDLAGVREGAIAVTWRGEPVSRWIDGPGSFGPGSAIEFVGRPPAGDDALYLDANLYQVAVDPERARAAGTAGRGRARQVPDSYFHTSIVDHVGLFHHQSPTGDPWIERPVLARRNRPRTVDLEIPIAGPVRPGSSQLIVGLGTVTDLPDLRGPGGAPIPEHNVEVWFGGPGSSLAHVADASTSGQQDWRLEFELPPGAVQPGVNRLQLRFTTDYFFSLVVVDRYGLRYPGPYHGPALDFPRDPRAAGYRAEGFTQPAIAAYAEHEDGSLTRLTPAVTATPGGYVAELRQLEAARFWVSESPHRPAVFTTEAPRDLLAEPAELVVVTESSFVGTPALEAYLAARSDLRPVVIDVEDIYNSVGFGMALPTAITDYLRLRDRVQPFSHVQLVGTDCYDRLNLISDCVSFIPLPMARVGVNIYSPSHNRLIDLDGDGVGDKALAQFSVRDEDELATIVRKGEAWRANRGADGESALWISEETDGIHDFAAQVERLRQRLSWPDGEMLDLTDHPNIATAREALRAGLDAGPAVTVFSGHSSPSIWAFRSLLTAGDVADLTNFGLPTIMLPLACETTYDISPDADVLGHQLLYAGEQGALAISGAVALSGLGDNERMAGLVLDGLNAGLTLGEAVQAGREILGSAYQTLQDNWMTQGDVAARIQP